MKGFSIQNSLSLIVTAAFIAALAAWMLHPPPDVNQTAMTVINMLLGALVAKFTTVVDYHFGSSKSAATKDDTISTMANASSASATTAATIAAAAAGAQPNGEPSAWADAQKTNTLAAFQAYLQKYPAGAHAAEAQTRIAGLSNP